MKQGEADCRGGGIDSSSFVNLLDERLRQALGDSNCDLQAISCRSGVS